MKCLPQYTTLSSKYKKELQTDICEAGLKLMNAKKFNKALNNSWIKYYCMSEEVGIIFSYVLSITIKSCLGYMTYSP